MTWQIRVLGAGAAALLFTQAAYAAPTLPAPIDPLVSLAMLGTAGSRAAVCAGSTAAVAGAAAALTQGPAPGCVLPVTGAPPPPPAAVPPPPPPVVGAEAGPGFPTIPVLLGLAAIIGIAIALASSGNDHNAVSPA